MIAKILHSSSSFDGIKYNEKKNKEGRSELLVAKNFGLLEFDEVKKEDYINYMNLVSKTNDRVKNVQFHATLSAKGREYNFDELKKIGIKWLEKMGYGECPYIIYGHSDTKNNHIHVVSTRVNKEGIKINDSMERIRSQKILNEIMQQDLSKKAQNDIFNFYNYRFENINQFKLLLEQAGWIVNEKDNNLNLIKGGAVQYSVPVSTISNKFTIENENKKRISQLKAIFKKYSPGLDYIQLEKFFKEKFGISLIYHLSKDRNKIYGFTIIDYPSKSVYKGSSIIKLNDILNNPISKEKIDIARSFINTLLSPADKIKIDLKEFKETLRKYGYDLSNDGFVSLKGSKSKLFSISYEELRILKYNGRLIEANKFNTINSETQEVLSQIFYVKKDDILIDDKINQSPTKNYDDIINSYIYNTSDPNNKFQESGIFFFKSGSNVYLIDKNGHQIIDISEYESVLRKESVEIAKLKEEKLKDINIDSYDYSTRGLKIIEEIFNIINQGEFGEEEKDIKKRRKKQIK